ncbi:hypothetical protein AWENTII_005091 [Aspergillus wentii]
MLLKPVHSVQRHQSPSSPIYWWGYRDINNPQQASYIAEVGWGMQRTVILDADSSDTGILKEWFQCLDSTGNY